MSDPHELAECVLSVVNEPEGVTLDTPLISSGLIDSLNVAKLLLLLEERFHRVVDPAEIGADNFDTLRQMAAFLGHDARS
ncbi:MAG: acyl carrier protein [Acidobacteria bacterium]|nr:acyl carrier protein [Acidobacteriota bacterium]